MLQGWVVIAVALAYIGLLFLVASYGDRTRGLGRSGRARLLIYPLSLAIYCTSWTFFGSVGSASRTGYEFLTIYIGPVLMIGLFSPLLVRIVRLAKAQNITSIADFIAARYGKSQAVAATVALIAIVGTIPYIALQLKAVSFSLETILAQIAPGPGVTRPLLGDIALFVALSMATFAVLFGTRHIDATEHQDGLMLAIATESIVKLFAFLAVGIFVTFWMFGGPGALFAAARAKSADGRPVRAAAAVRHAARQHAAVVRGDHSAAAAVPRGGGREQQRERDQARGLAVSALSGADQPVRGADRARRPADVPGRPHRQRHVRAGAAAARRLERAHHRRLRRRTVGGDRHGDRGIGRAVDHGVERHRHAAGAAAARGADLAAAAMSARCCSRCGGSRSSPSCCSPTCITAPPATRSSPPSACCRSPRSRSWRRRFSAACSGGAPPPAAPSPA